MKYIKYYGYLAIAMLLYFIGLQILYQPNFLQNQLPTLSAEIRVLIKGVLFFVGLFGAWFFSDKALKNF